MPRPIDPPQPIPPLPEQINIRRILDQEEEEEEEEEEEMAYADWAELHDKGKDR